MERVALLTEAPVVTADVLGLSGLAPTPPVPDTPPRRPPRPPWPPWWTPPSEPTSRKRSKRPAGMSRAPRRGSASRATRSAIAWRSTGSVRASLPAASCSTRGRAVAVGVAGRHREAVPGPAAAPPPVSAPAGGSSGPVAIRWERRRLAVLLARLASDRDAGPLDTGRMIDALVDKVRSFGGRVEELGATGFVALFGLDPVEHPVRRAALAASPCNGRPSRPPTPVRSPASGSPSTWAPSSSGGCWTPRWWTRRTSARCWARWACWWMARSPGRSWSAPRPPGSSPEGSTSPRSVPVPGAAPRSTSADSGGGRTRGAVAPASWAGAMSWSSCAAGWPPPCAARGRSWRSPARRASASRG